MKPGRERRPRQDGAALLIILLAAACSFAMLLGAALGDGHRDKERRNALVLTAAKEALIGYAVAKGNPPGSFPCPDLANNGTAASSCSASMIGRLPWKTIGLGDLRDADGECLWYALSPPFRNGVGTLNSATVGTLTIAREDGTPVANQVVAVIFAPGGPIAGNDRTPAGNGPCTGNNSPANYLDAAANGINNASGNRSGNAFTFVVADRGGAFNDQLVYVAARELFAALHPRVAAEIRGDGSNGLQRYYASHGNVLPWAAAVPGGLQQAALATGYVPYGDPQLAYPGSAWLNGNGWFAIARYRFVQNGRFIISLGGQDYAFSF